MRLFVGITPTTPDMSWVSSERWHVTLAFPGEAYPDPLPAPTTRLDHVADRLARAMQREIRAGGVPVERRPWRAHLTNARWRPSPDRDAAGSDLGLCHA